MFKQSQLLPNFIILSITALSPTYATGDDSQNTHRHTSTQSHSCVDDDGDGWGWTGTQSCKADGQIEAAPQVSHKVHSDCLDTNGDGWGWYNGQRCQTSGTPATPANRTNVIERNNTVSSAQCLDTNGDGWGWHNGTRCRTSTFSSTQATQQPITNAVTASANACIDTDGDGWGWDGQQSCNVRVASTQLQSAPLITDYVNNSRSSGTTIHYQNTPFQKHGKLSVCKRNNYMLCDQHGQPVQLTGMSSHGIHWSGWHTYNRGGCLTEDSFDLLSQTWNTDVFRIAMYVKYDGYESNPEETIRHVNTIISELSDRGLYVIVDFHILAGTGISGNPLDYANTAETFFRRIVQDNNHRQNVLYEIANEPQASDLTWGHIKQYGNRITKAIREEEHPDNHAIVIVGTNAWSSFGMASNGNFLEIVDNPVIDSTGNLMYAFHFYANDSSHIARGYKDALSQAVHHIPVFVTEWGTQDASGGGINDFGRAREYVQLMQQKKISWTMWNFSDAEESSAVWNNTSFCGQNHGWHDPANLSTTGQFIKRIFDES